MRGYTGPDHIGTIEALRKLAEARYPDHWSNVPKEELAIWDGLGISLAADLWQQHLQALLPSHVPMLVQRAADYHEAAANLLDALITENLVAYVIEDNGSLQKIFSNSWRTSEAALALYRGSAWLDDGETAVCRLILLPRADFALVLQTRTTSDRAMTSEPTRKRSGRPPKHDPAYVRSIVLRLMDANGEFNVAVEVWNAQARLEEAVREELGSDLAEGRLRAAITPHLAEWRTLKARNAAT